MDYKKGDTIYAGLAVKINDLLISEGCQIVKGTYMDKKNGYILMDVPVRSQKTPNIRLIVPISRVGPTLQAALAKGYGNTEDIEFGYD